MPVLLALCGGALVAGRPQIAPLFILAIVLLAATYQPLLAIPLVVLLLSLPTSGVFVVLGDDPERRASVILLSVAAAIASRRNTPQCPTAAALIALGVLALAFVSVQAAMLSSSSVARRAGDLFVFLAIVATMTAYRREDRSLRLAIAMVVLVMTAEAALGVAQFVSGGPLMTSSALSVQNLIEARNLSGSFRGLGTFYHGNSLALALVLAIPLAQWLRRTSGRVALEPWLLCVIVMLLAVAATLSRAGALVGALVLLWPSLSRTGIRKFRVVGVAAGASFVGFVLVSQVAVFRRVADRFGGSQALRDRGSAAARQSNLEGAFNAWRDRPLTGFGFGRSAEVGQAYGGQRDLGAHNLYLDVLVGGGIVLGLLLVGLIVLVRRGASGERSVRETAAGGLVAFLVYGLVESTAQGAFLAMLAVLVGLVLERDKTKIEGAPRSPSSCTSLISEATVERLPSLAT